MLSLPWACLGIVNSPHQVDPKHWACPGRILILQMALIKFDLSTNWYYTWQSQWNNRKLLGVEMYPSKRFFYNCILLHWCQYKRWHTRANKVMSQSMLIRDRKTWHLKSLLDWMTVLTSNVAKKAILRKNAALPKSRNRTRARDKAKVM